MDLKLFLWTTEQFCASIIYTVFFFFFSLFRLLQLIANGFLCVH